MADSRTQFRNRLLNSLHPDDLALLAPHLEFVTVAVRHPMESAGRDIAFAYFMESGIVSVVAKTPRDRQVEAGIIGCEGMSALGLILGDTTAVNDTYVQVAGSAFRLEIAVLRAAIERSSRLHASLLRFAQAFLVQVTQTALANGTAKIPERLARWLLMSQDRLASDELPLTHEFLALMLAIRRPGVTVALQGLEGRGLIRNRRGNVTILDRAGLAVVADGSYGVPEVQYERLIGAAASDDQARRTG